MKSLRPTGFGLWVFASNEGAQRFYRRHGLVPVRRTDGSENEEGAPDVEMLWPGQDPVGKRILFGSDQMIWPDTIPIGLCSKMVTCCCCVWRAEEATSIRCPG